MFFNINLCAVRIAHHLLKYARYALQQSTHLRDEKHQSMTGNRWFHLDMKTKGKYSLLE